MLGTSLPDEMVDAVPVLPVSFTLATEKRLQLKDIQDLDAMSAWRHYGYHIGRYPQDLRAHVQRLLTGIDAGLKDRLPGALQDLFLSIGDNGFSLRETMLELSKASLTVDDASFFETWLMSGRPENLQWREGSVLTDSFSHMDKLVVPEKDESETGYLTVIDEVQSYLEYGQIDAAQQLLETELEKTPADIQLAQELLNIYLYTRDKDSLEKMTGQLQQAGVELSEDWQHVQSESANW